MRRRRRGPGFEAKLRERRARRECCCWDCLRRDGLTPPKSKLESHLPLYGSGEWKRGIAHYRLNPFADRNLERKIASAIRDMAKKAEQAKDQARATNRREEVAA